MPHTLVGQELHSLTTISRFLTLMTTLHKLLTHRLVCPVFTALLGNVFQKWMFLCSQVHVLAGWWLSHNMTWCCYVTAYNSGGSSASHASVRGDCLSFGLSWYCLPLRSNSTRLSTCTDWLVFQFSRHSLHADPLWTPLPTIPLVLHDISIGMDPQRTPLPAILPLVTLRGMTYSTLASLFIVPLSSDGSLLIKLFRLSADMPQYLICFLL
jgi:hypothetical protein